MKTGWEPGENQGRNLGGRGQSWTRGRPGGKQQRVGENNRKLSRSLMELKGCGGRKYPGEGPGL